MELRVPHVTNHARAPMPRVLHSLQEFWPMPLPLMNHSALALFAQRIGLCVIWVCISSSSSFGGETDAEET